MAREHDRQARPTEEEEDALVEESHQSGGDAPAAGSIAEREAVATEDDDLFGAQEG